MCLSCFLEMKNLFLLQPKPARFSFSGPTQRLYLSLPFFPFLPAQPNPAGPIPSPRPSLRPLTSLPPTGGPHLSGPSPSSRARLGLEPESGHATPRCPSPWRTGQGLPRPLFKRRPTPLGPSEPQPAPPHKTLAREPPLPSSELCVAPPFRCFPSMFSPPRRFASW